MSEWGTETPASELQPPTDAFWPMDDMSTGSFPFIFPSWYVVSPSLSRADADEECAGTWSRRTRRRTTIL